MLVDFFYQNMKGEVVQSFNPLPKQKLFMYRVLEDQNAKFTWYCGGFGSGKSFIGSHTAIRLAMMAPGGRGLIARNTLVDLKATTMKTFFDVCDPRLIYKYNKSENLLTFINGHEVYFWGLDDIEKLKSLELGWFWMDEVDEVNPIAFDVAIGRLRHQKQPKRLGMITSNSEGKNWTYKKFIRGEGVRTEQDLSKYYVIKAPSNENTHLPDDYLDVLNSYTGDLYERYVKASFEVFEGQIYKEFRRAIHVIPAFAIPDDWVKIRAIDHGERNPTACLWGAIAPNGDVFIYREHYEAGQIVSYHADKVAQMSEGEEIKFTVIDPSTKSTRGATGKKVDKEWKIEMRKYEDNFVLRYGVNSVQAGIARVHSYLFINEEKIHVSTKKPGAPKLYIFDTCPITADEVETYKWAKIKSASEDDPEEKVRKRDDHAVDALRYLIMEVSKPSGSVHQYQREVENKELIIPSKRDQVLPSVLTEDDLLRQMQKENPKDFLLPF